MGGGGIEIPMKITSSDVVNARGIILTIKKQKLRAIIYLAGDIFFSQALNVQ
jgi:hypothetical protein